MEEWINEPWVRLGILAVVVVLVVRWAQRFFKKPTTPPNYVRLRCLSCNWTGSVGKYNKRCPSCSGTDLIEPD